MSASHAFLGFSPPIVSGFILCATLLMFVSERVRHDLVALLGLTACIVTGLVGYEDALVGFADPAVVAVAAVLVVGRALELSNAASMITQRLIPQSATFHVQMTILLVLAAFLSAFMNNIAALVVTMPIATSIALSSNRTPAAILMPLSFATILGGVTTLIGTPANLIISSVREKQLGEGFSFFDMTGVGSVVAIAGIGFVVLVGWRLLPSREGTGGSRSGPLMTYEMVVDQDVVGAEAIAEVRDLLDRKATRILGAFRNGKTVNWRRDGFLTGNRVLLSSRIDPAKITETLPVFVAEFDPVSGGDVTQVMVAHGSNLIGRTYGSISESGEHAIHLVAGGPRAATVGGPLAEMVVAAGDQIFLEGKGEDIDRFASLGRLIEITRFNREKVGSGRASAIVGIFLAAIVAIVAGGVPPAVSFLVAATAIVALRLIPPREVYNSIDWSIIVLLAAMIPVGSSFDSSGAAEIVADWLGNLLAGQVLFVSIGVICFVTMILSIFLNNVATALVMAPLGIRVAEVLGVAPDAMLLAVLVGASSDFLTPIGHQNNLLVMGPGGYRFSDYSKMGLGVAVIVVGTAAAYLAVAYR